MTLASRSPTRTAELLGQLRTSLGNGHPSIHSIWQKAFDYDDGHLFRLVMLEVDQELDDPVDLVDYCLDFQYEEVQPDLFRYALPVCLAAWRRDLLGETTKYEAFVEHFYPALVRSDVFDRLLSKAESSSVTCFMQQSILDEIREQTVPILGGAATQAHRWLRALTTSGVVLPDLRELWAEWWTIRSAGEAAAAIQYASCLVYDDSENPVFGAWTKTDGGGPPTLWEYAGHLYEDRWRPANVALLRETLTFDRIAEVLDKSVGRLTDLAQLSVARAVRASLSSRSDVFRSRCEELPRFLEETRGPGTHLEWSR